MDMTFSACQPKTWLCLRSPSADREARMRRPPGWPEPGIRQIGPDKLFGPRQLPRSLVRRGTCIEQLCGAETGPWRS
ncbi:hypothetical protein SKAU_G00338130 [Synaphobranchus kaupii]|uniref:Uncharacterized protein n=1 Tax=Synaphobranchus kaupii TaxID=118154 RepID=A0A9Q1IIX9_SYNKA|nr:hypothetical protein SKAU_G00338130 [Synaphobranchus kaupii]